MNNESIINCWLVTTAVNTAKDTKRKHRDHTYKVKGT